MSNSNGKDLIFLKTILLGDSTVGKTTLKNNYIGKAFNTDMLPTLGTDFASKLMKYKNHNVNFQIWDIGGQMSFLQVRKTFYGGSSAGIIIYDVLGRESFNNVKYWLHEFQENSGAQNKAIILIGNKIDLREKDNKNAITKEEGQSLADELSKIFNINILFFETSALTGENIENVFDSICEFYLNSI